jgi:hypothetical protein
MNFQISNDILTRAYDILSERILNTEYIPLADGEELPDPDEITVGSSNRIMSGRDVKITFRLDIHRLADGMYGELVALFKNPRGNRDLEICKFFEREDLASFDTFTESAQSLNVSCTITTYSPELKLFLQVWNDASH